MYLEFPNIDGGYPLPSSNVFIIFDPLTRIFINDIRTIILSTISLGSIFVAARLPS